MSELSAAVPLVCTGKSTQRQQQCCYTQNVQAGYFSITCWVLGVLGVAPLAIECNADAALLAGILGPAGNKRVVQMCEARHADMRLLAILCNPCQFTYPEIAAL
jgi:hypothetical protein